MNSSEPSYVNHLNILHKPLELIDAISLTQACKDQWYTLFVNASLSPTLEPHSSWPTKSVTHPHPLSTHLLTFI